MWLSGVTTKKARCNLFTPFVFWPCLLGAIFLVYGVFSVRGDLRQAPGLEKVIALGPVFVAAALAAFGAEHIAGASFIQKVVPAWMPGQLFWAYFVGLALIAAAVSLLAKRYVPLTAVMLTIMFVLFVLLLHSPRVAANPRDRISWAVALRDLTFAAGTLCLAGMHWKDWREGGTNVLITIGRVITGGVLVFYGVEHFLHAEYVPVVPLEKLTPVWMPLRMVWVYVVGAVVLACGVALLAKFRARAAAAWLGLVIALVTLFFYLPILLRDVLPFERLEGLNYLFDTLLFGGTVLLVAAAMPRDRSAGGDVS